MNFTVVIAEPLGFPKKSLNQLKRKSEVFIGPFSRNELKEAIKSCNALIVRLTHSIDKELLGPAKELKYIVSATTGLNHIDTTYCKDKGIKIISLRGEPEFLQYITGTAELALSLMLLLARPVLESQLDVQQGNWNRDSFRGSQLFGKTLGIIGMGRLGSQMATY